MNTGFSAQRNKVDSISNLQNLRIDDNYDDVEIQEECEVEYGTFAEDGSTDSEIEINTDSGADEDISFPAPEENPDIGQHYSHSEENRNQKKQRHEENEQQNEANDLFESSDDEVQQNFRYDDTKNVSPQKRKNTRSPPVLEESTTAPLPENKSSMNKFVPKLICQCWRVNKLNQDDALRHLG